MKKLTIRVDDDTFNKLNIRLKDTNQSMNKFVNKLIVDELLKPITITNCIEQLDKMIDDISNAIDKIDKRQQLHYRVTKQHFANRGFLSNADVNEDNCLKEILKKDNGFND